MKKIFLDNENWTLSGDKIGSISATVPGCVHTELAKQNLIPDMFWRDNNIQLQWIENEDWQYSCTFNASIKNAESIVFDGIDTYADIYLNGIKIGSSNDMFIPHEFNIKGILKDGENNLAVNLRSPIKEVKDMPERRGAFTKERINTRRMQCTYGWDWVDRFVTCGIFRSVYLKYVDGIYITDTYVTTDFADRFGAQIYCELEFADYTDGALTEVKIISPEGKTLLCDSFFVREPLAVRRYDIASPELWYPAGYGEQPIYKLIATVNGNEHITKFGIRTLRVIQLEDPEGSEYYLKAQEMRQTPMGLKLDKNTVSSGFKVTVNGTEIFCKGGDWVPCEPFPSSETDEKFAKLISMAKNMNLNFLRVWGGGLFERDEFYDLCDEAGILIAHDFLLACGTYPEKEDWFLAAQQKEALYAVKKLRNHPSLAWYHGDNENAWLSEEKMPDFTGRDGALKGTAPALYRYDRSRNFLISSPYGGNVYGSITRGTSHSTNYCYDMLHWALESDGSEFYDYFRNFVPRFESEAPTFGMAQTCSLKKFLSEKDIFEDSNEEMLNYHSKNNPGLGLTIYGAVRTLAENHLGNFANAEDMLFKLRYFQYEWVRVIFENIKCNIGYNNGLLFWMYNDCWPAAMGWSFVDYYCIPKSNYYSFKRCGKHLLPSVTFNGNNYEYYLTNDCDINTECNVYVYAMDISNNCAVVGKTEFSITSQNYCAKKHILPDLPTGENILIVCETVGDGLHDKCFYKKGKLPIVPGDGITVIKQTETCITLKASKYVHAVELGGEYLFDDNCFIMLPNEERTVNFEKLSDNAEDISVVAYSF